SFESAASFTAPRPTIPGAGPPSLHVPTSDTEPTARFPGRRAVGEALGARLQDRAAPAAGEQQHGFRQTVVAQNPALIDYRLHHEPPGPQPRERSIDADKRGFDRSGG